VRKGDLRKVSDQMKIPSFPFAIVYFSNDQNDIVSGPADEDTAIKILEHRKPVATPPPPPPQPKPTPPPPAPKATYIRDLNRPIEEDDSWKNFKQTTHQYDWVDPVNQYVFRPDFVPIAPEVVLPIRQGPAFPAAPVVVEAPRPTFINRPAPIIEQVVAAPPRVERVVAPAPTQVVVEKPIAPTFNPWATRPVAAPAPVVAAPRPVVSSGPVLSGPRPVVSGPVVSAPTTSVVSSKLRRP